MTMGGVAIAAWAANGQRGPGRGGRGAGRRGLGPGARSVALALGVRSSQPRFAVAAAVARRRPPPAFRASAPRSNPCGLSGTRSVSLSTVSPLRPSGDGHQDRQRGLQGGVQPGARRWLGRHLVRNFPLLSRPRSPSSRWPWCTEPSSRWDGLRVILCCLPQP